MGNTKRSFYYGWLIVAATWFSYIALTSVTSYSSSVITTHLILDRGWAENTVGFQSSLQYASIAVFSIPTGILARKRGCRLPYILAGFIGGSVFLVFFLTNAPHLLYVSSFFILGSSIAMGGQVTAPIMIDAWFDRRKSLAMAIVMTAGGIGGFFLPQVAEAIYSSYGVRTCWIVMSIAEFSSLIPAFLIYRNHPEDIGEVRDGREWTALHPAQTSSASKKSESEMTLTESYHTKEFLIVAIGNTIFRIAQTVFIAYAMLHVIHMGLSSAIAVSIISASNVLNLAGRLLVPFIEKLHIKRNALSVICFVMLTIGFGMFAVSSSVPVLMLSGIIAGLSLGLLTTLVPLLLTEYCEETYFSEQYGMLNTISFACMIVSPLLVSASASVLGNYTPAFTALAVLCCISAVISLFLKKKVAG